MADKERAVLGSGKIYIMEFTGESIPEDSVIETAGNQLGIVNGGASLEYKPEFYTGTSDDGTLSKSALVKEEATLKSGIMTFKGDTYKKLCSTATVSEDTAKKRTTIEIGGVGNYDGKSYVIRFVHKDKIDGDVRVTIVGQNQSGFSLAFAKDKETVVDVEFKALPNDNKGTLIKIDLDEPAVA